MKSVSLSSTTRTLSGSVMNSSVLWRYVGRQPVDAEPSHRVGELGEVQRLTDKAVGSVRIAAQAIALFVRGGENDHRHEIGARVGPQSLQYVQTSDARQIEIEQNHRGQVRTFACRELALPE